MAEVRYENSSPPSSKKSDVKEFCSICTLHLYDNLLEQKLRVLGNSLRNLMSEMIEVSSSRQAVVCPEENASA
ncbi:hypothetical protein NC651_020853 [Populus alba x Populus x berolinensis]|nr:hypothetical protein NC651_020853 [Populus alba x Populus x berolinensis]